MASPSPPSRSRSAVSQTHETKKIMNTSNLRRLNAETIRRLSPSIREDWRTDKMNVFLALCVKDGLKKGQKLEVVVASAGVLIFEWLAGYLKQHHEATALIGDCDEIVVSLMHESVTLAGVLP
jgi:hypothetical protein